MSDAKIDEWLVALDKLTEATARYRDAVLRKTPSVEVFRSSMMILRLKYIRLTLELD